MDEHSTDATATALPGVDPGAVVDKAALLTGGAAFGVTVVPLPGKGVIKIRPLSRAEALEMYEQEMPAAEMERAVLHRACVDPTFTLAEAGQWQTNSGAGGDIMTVVNTILEISGMVVGSGKAAYKRFRGAS